MKIIDKTPSNRAMQKSANCLNLCGSLIRVNRESEENIELNLEGVVSFEIVLEEEFNEMLKESLKSIENDISSSLKTLVETNPEIGFKMRNFLENDMIQLLAYIQDRRISLDILSLYILFYKYVKAETLYKPFEKFSESTRYELILNTLDHGGLPLKVKIDMHRIAKEIVKKYFT